MSVAGTASPEVQTTAQELRGMLDDFAVEVLKICLSERQDAGMLALLADNRVHTGYVLDLLGFDAVTIMERLVMRLEHASLWQRYLLRRAIRRFNQNSFVYLFEQMQYPAPDHQWYTDAISMIMGTGIAYRYSELGRLRAAHRAGNEALQLPEPLRTDKSRFITLSVLVNVLIILQYRYEVNIDYADCYQAVQPEIDKHIRDLAAVWQLLPFV